MSRVEELQSEIGKLSPGEMQELRDWLENVLEDQLELREEFKTKIEQSEQDMAAGALQWNATIVAPFQG